MPVCASKKTFQRGKFIQNHADPITEAVLCVPSYMCVYVQVVHTHRTEGIRRDVRTRQDSLFNK